MAGERYDEEPIGVVGQGPDDGRGVDMFKGIQSKVTEVRRLAEGMSAEEAKRVTEVVEGVSAERRVAAMVALGRVGGGVLGVLGLLSTGGQVPRRLTGSSETEEM